MGKINEKWHKANKMPKYKSLEQRLSWHKEHMKNCSCHPTPKKLLDLINGSTVLKIVE